MGGAEAKALLGSDEMEQAREYADRVVALTGGKALYWRFKALDKGLTHLRTGGFEIPRNIVVGAVQP